MAADPKSAVNGKPKYNPAQPWRVEDSMDTYHVNAWGKGYFSIGENGHVVVRPDTTVVPAGQPSRDIDLLEVVEGLKARGQTMIIVEQSLNVALSVADRAIFMEKGTVQFDGPAAELGERGDQARAVFLGHRGDA